MALVIAMSRQTKDQSLIYHEMDIYNYSLGSYETQQTYTFYNVAYNYLFLWVHRTSIMIQEHKLTCALRIRLNKEVIGAAVLNTSTAFINMVDVVMLVWMGS